MFYKFTWSILALFWSLWPSKKIRWLLSLNLMWKFWTLLQLFYCSFLYLMLFWYPTLILINISKFFWAILTLLPTVLSDTVSFGVFYVVFTFKCIYGHNWRWQNLQILLYWRHCCYPTYPWAFFSESMSGVWVKMYFECVLF